MKGLPMQAFSRCTLAQRPASHDHAANFSGYVATLEDISKYAALLVQELVHLLAQLLLRF